MAKKKTRVDDSFVLFDVIYEVGTRSSRRKAATDDIIKPGLPRPANKKYGVRSWSGG